ncbi:DUF6058 family natural product biosynthesis protein [Georgenia sp. SUBG003]|uniref:DUF6058 family natural product biosynthesis protein n=1 Tax=Georgenia sp. SUBG003 TaxID=1497974 RepID=UPI0004D5B9FB|nr:hypothetical protein DA06_09585 [Georgenia sp. SUBG003]
MSLERVRELYLQLNGNHPMTPEDDDYVRRHFVPVPDTDDHPREQVLRLMAERRLPLPAYLLSDGTPMVHTDFLGPVQEAGSETALRDWFLGQWPAEERDVAEAEWTHGYLSGQYVCLWSVSPTTIRAKDEVIEEIKKEIAALEEGGGSRDRLAAAVDRLDELEPPFTGYDRKRFGGPTSRQVWIDDVRTTHLAQERARR